MDCVDRYHGVKLAVEDRHKNTFNTEWGMFRYLEIATLKTQTPFLMHAQGNQLK